MAASPLQFPTTAISLIFFVSGCPIMLQIHLRRWRRNDLPAVTPAAIVYISLLGFCPICVKASDGGCWQGLSSDYLLFLFPNRPKGQKQIRTNVYIISIIFSKEAAMPCP